MYQIYEQILKNKLTYKNFTNNLTNIDLYTNINVLINYL